MNRGTYVILIKLTSSVDISRPRNMKLPEGLYVYVGSAMNSLTGRLRRHLKKKKKIHWHIDQLTEMGDIILLIGIPGRSKLEEKLSRFLSEYFQVIKGFGSSDLKVDGNLFKVNSFSSFFGAFQMFFEKFNDFSK